MVSNHSIDKHKYNKDLKYRLVFGFKIFFGKKQSYLHLWFNVSAPFKGKTQVKNKKKKKKVKTQVKNTRPKKSPHFKSL